MSVLRSVVGLVVSTALGAAITIYVTRAIEARGHGVQSNPLPLKETPKGNLVYPEAREVRLDELVRAADTVGVALTEPMAAQFLLASRNGKVVGNNPVYLSAGKTWVGPWTVMRMPQVSGGQPRYRWQGIRVYPTLAAGVRGWADALPPSARIATNLDDFAMELARGGWIATNPRDYAALLQDALQGAVPRG